RRDAGTVTLLGHSLEQAAGVVPQGVAGLIEVPAFYPYLSGRKNLTLLARLDGAGGSQGRRHIDEALEQTGLSAQADVPVSAYSPGMRQRLGRAGALLRPPQLLFLDEPTSALDPAGARDVRALARRLAAAGTAVVLSSHDMAEVEELCAVITIIDRGHVLFSGAVDELRKSAPAPVHMLRTSNDGAAHAMASSTPGVRATACGDEGLEVSAESDALDDYVIALGRGGIAVRGLERRARSLESLFLELTGSSGGSGPSAPASAPPPAAPPESGDPVALEAGRWPRAGARRWAGVAWRSL